MVMIRAKFSRYSESELELMRSKVLELVGTVTAIQNQLVATQAEHICGGETIQIHDHLSSYHEWLGMVFSINTNTRNTNASYALEKFHGRKRSGQEFREGHHSFQRKSMNSGVKPHEKLRIQVIPCPENFRLVSKSGEFAEHEFPTFSSILFDFENRPHPPLIAFEVF